IWLAVRSDGASGGGTARDLCGRRHVKYCEVLWGGESGDISINSDLALCCGGGCGRASFDFGAEMIGAAQLQVCDVCRILDGDTSRKRCTWCSMCQSWLCEADVGNWLRRW